MAGDKCSGGATRRGGPPLILRRMGRWTVYDRTIMVYPELRKYYVCRDLIFPKTRNNGLMVDRESWYSITPEALANSITAFIRENLGKAGSAVSVMDGFCGVGGNTISFLRAGFHVTSVDLDYRKLKYLKHNVRECLGADIAEEIRKGERLECVHGDLFEFLRSTSWQADVLFASPPWGGISYSKMKKYDPQLCRLKELEEAGGKIAGSRIFFVPKNTAHDDIRKEVGHCLILRATCRGRTMGILVITGALASAGGASNTI